MERAVEAGIASPRPLPMSEADVDLTGIEPTRWREVRRRVAILDEYVGLRRPSRATTEAFAERIGLSVSQLYYLARAWRLKRDASAIPGARARVSVRKPRRLPKPAIAVAQAVVEELGPLARRKDVIAEVAARCARAGTKKPSDSTIANMISATRAGMDAPIAVAPEILIEDCTVSLPVAHGRSVVMPRLMLAIVLPERRIVAAEISLDPGQAPSPAALMAKLTEASTPRGTPLRIRAPHLPRTWRAAIGAIALDAGRHRPTLGRLTGNRIGDLAVRQGGRSKPGDALAASRHATALGTEDAERAILDAIAAHNARLASLPAGGFVVDRAR